MTALITVTVLMLVQYTFFGALVAKGRSTFQVSAPAMTGPEGFERLVRVHLNTQERLILMLPLMVTAAQFWSPLVVSAAGVLFLIGRVAYWRGYVEQPAKRMLGNVLTMVAIGVCLLATLAGLVKSAL
ncbi:MAG: MAPEG family protein [Rubrivivax sp.]|nr:MAPEG family protein [Rubrivivax sp.]